MISAEGLPPNPDKLAVHIFANRDGEREFTIWCEWHPGVNLWWVGTDNEVPEVATPGTMSALVKNGWRYIGEGKDDGPGE